MARRYMRGKVGGKGGRPVADQILLLEIARAARAETEEQVCGHCERIDGERQDRVIIIAGGELQRGDEASEGAEAGRRPIGQAPVARPFAATDDDAVDLVG